MFSWTKDVNWTVFVEYIVIGFLVGLGFSLGSSLGYYFADIIKIAMDVPLG